MPLKTYRSSGGSHFNLPKRQGALRLIERRFHCCSSPNFAPPDRWLGEQHVQRVSTGERQAQLLPPPIVQTFSPSQKRRSLWRGVLSVKIQRNIRERKRAWQSASRWFQALKRCEPPLILVHCRSLAITPNSSDGRSHGKGMDCSRQPHSYTNN